MKGNVLSEKQREALRQANLRRVYVRGVHKRSQEFKEGVRRRMTGSGNPSYNPDREHVAARYKIARWCVDTMRQILRDLNQPRTSKRERSSTLLGYTKEEFRKHIESQFLPGMTWLNHGKGGWEVDHVTPVAWYVKNGITDPAVICALSNLRPLWAIDNMRKGAKLVTAQA